MLCTMQELLDEAVRENKAIGGFNAANMECTMGILSAAEDMQSSVILQIAEKRMQHSPIEYMAPMMLEAARRAKVKVAVHLDHGKSMDMVKKVLEYGFTSVMFDGSDYSLSENIHLTNMVCDVAKKYGATVEAELGVLGGNEGDGEHEVLCTDVDEAKQFLTQTHVNALAIAIGNAHGHYHGVPKLNFDVLHKIDKISNVPLVLHGGSGITDEQFHRAISLGIRKINIATASFDALVEGASDYVSQTGEHDYFGMNEIQISKVKESVKHCIQIFNNR